MTVAMGDILRVAARQEWGGREDVVNVLHYEVFTAPTGGAEADVLEDLADGLSLSYQTIEARLSDDLLPVDISVFNVTQDAPVGVTTWTIDYAGGTGTGENAPLFCSAMILYPTSVKRRIGRIYVGGLTEATIAGNTFASGVNASMLTFGTVLMSLSGGPNLGVYRYGVYSRSNGTFTVPSTVRVAPLVAITSRRKSGRGS